MEPLGNDRFRGAFAIEERADHRYTVVGWIDRFETWRRDLRAKVDARRDVDGRPPGRGRAGPGRRTPGHGRGTRPAQGGGTVAGVAEPEGGPRRRLRRGPARADARERRPAPAGVVPTRAARDRRRAARAGSAPGTSCSRARPRPSRDGTARSPTSIARLAVRGATWASTCSTCRRSIRSARRAPQGPEQRADARGRTTRAARGRSARRGRPHGGPPGARHARRTSSGWSAAARDARDRGRARHRVPVLARPPVGARASGVVPAPARRHDPVRREPAEEVPGHLPVRLRDARTGEALWEALRERGPVLDRAAACAIFRVDNPHTKPFAFWEWLIARGAGRRTRTSIFLAEAFTRPKVMYRLAKVGFTQSYTYFTWRNTQAGAHRVLHRADADASRASTSGPTSGRTRPTSCTSTCRRAAGRAFAARLILAATLAASYGIYGPAFELWSTRRASRAARSTSTRRSTRSGTGTSSGADSLAPLIARVNRIRRENPALQTNRTPALPRHRTTTQLIAYSKVDARTAPTSSLVVVNLDPHHAQSGWVDLDLGELGLAPHEPYPGARPADRRALHWHGARNYVQLDPATLPAHVLRDQRRARASATSTTRDGLVAMADRATADRRRTRSGTRTRSSTSCTSARSTTATATASATSAGLTQQARLPAGPRRHRALAAAVLPVAAARRRLRHRRLHRRPPRLRHAARLPAASCARRTRAACASSPSWCCNHTSDQHPWFQRARRAPAGSAERDFYVWSDTPERYRDARIIFKDFETSNWTWDPVAERLLLAPLLLATSPT